MVNWAGLRWAPTREGVAMANRRRVVILVNESILMIKVERMFDEVLNWDWVRKKILRRVD